MSEPIVTVDFNNLWTEGVIARPSVNVVVGQEVLARDYYEPDMEYRATVVKRTERGVFLKCHWEPR